MKHQVPGLADVSRDSRLQIPDGIFLVSVGGAQFRWHAQKPFYVVRFCVLEPMEFAGKSIVGRLYCAPKGDVEAGLVPAGFSL